jgi:hypothetical protein
VFFLSFVSHSSRQSSFLNPLSSSSAAPTTTTTSIERHSQAAIPSSELLKCFYGVLKMMYKQRIKPTSPPPAHHTKTPSRLPPLHHLEYSSKSSQPRAVLCAKMNIVVLSIKLILNLGIMDLYITFFPSARRSFSSFLPLSLSHSLGKCW